MQSLLAKCSNLDEEFLFTLPCFTIEIHIETATDTREHAMKTALDRHATMCRVTEV